VFKPRKEEAQETVSREKEGVGPGKKLPTQGKEETRTIAGVEKVFITTNRQKQGSYHYEEISEKTSGKKNMI